MSNSQWGPQGAQYPPPSGPPVGGPPQPSYGAYPSPEAPSASFGWGPQFGPGGPQGPHFAPGGPRPKRRNAGLFVSLAVLGGLVVALAVVIVLSTREDDTGTAARPSPGVTTAPPAPTVEPTPSRVPTTRPTQSVRPTTAPTTKTTTRPTPKPPTDQQVVTRDGFYFTGLHRGVGCREPALALDNQRNTQNYYALVTQCLNRAWARQVAAGGDRFRAPRLLFWSTTVQTPCAGGSTVSFYCPANETIYIKYDDDIKLWRERTDRTNRLITRMYVTFTAAHEYGHHLQEISGILPAARDLGYNYRAPREQMLLVSRRIEIQASCFAAVFMGANRSSYGITGAKLSAYRYLEGALGDENARGGPRDHGSRASNKQFMSQGFATLNNAFCNTFMASASKVS